MYEYTIELTWDECREVPTAYICQNGVRVALLYEDPVLKEGDPSDPTDWTDDLDAWELGPSSQHLFGHLRLGVEYSKGVRAILAQYGRSAHNMADPVNPKGEK